MKQRLKTAGYRVKDVHTVVVTHSHPDHFGGAGRIAREAGAELITHHAFSTWTVKGPSPQRALSEGEARRLEIEAAALRADASTSPPDELPTINDDPTSCTTTPTRPRRRRARGARSRRGVRRTKGRPLTRMGFQKRSMAAGV